MANVLQKIDSMLYDIIRCNWFEFGLNRQTSRCVTFDSSEGTAPLSMISLSHFEDDPHYTRVTPPLAPMITYVCSCVENGQNSTFRELAAWRQLCARRYIVYDLAVK